ncbi:MAG: hypothetical protein ACJ757_06035 [Gaiellaceae bacterium]
MRIDEDTNRITARITLRGGGSTKLAYGAGFLWALTPVIRTGAPSTTLLAKINPQTNRVVAYAHLAGAADSFAVGRTAIWLIGAAVTELDLRTFRPLGQPVRVHAGNAAIGTRAIWLTASSGRVLRLDRKTRRLEQPALDIGQSADQIAIATTGTVWVTDSIDRVLVRIGD